MFIPTTSEELQLRSWDGLDIILVTGDSYIDSPHIGIAVIGKVLIDAGYRVGIIAQPDLESGRDICRLGEPRLFWGVTGGCIDSMVANRTASGKKRKRDDYTPGCVNNRRPDRAVIVYSNYIRKFFKNTVPIVLGGIEASLRRIAHYDFWTDKIRRSILFDAKADYLLYGMAERSIVELADLINKGSDASAVRGICYISKKKPADCIELPSFNESCENKHSFITMFNLFYQNNDPLSASCLAQQQDTRYLVQNPPAHYLSTSELDRIYRLGYEREQHPFYAQMGNVKALDTIRFSITTHRGCYGECNFCAIAVHQGRTIRWRSKKSILAEVRGMVKHPLFKGIINDVGGPTANMYGFECIRKMRKGACPDKRCIFPHICSQLPINHSKQIEMLQELRAIKGIRKVFVASGLRYDLILDDQKFGTEYLKGLVRHHVSGQLKIAPEHSERKVLELMGKPMPESLLKFRELFLRLNRSEKKKQFLTYYIIAAHPGCTRDDMQKLKVFARQKLNLLPEQVQVFTPTPSTYSTLMYYTGLDPISGEPCFVEKSVTKKDLQKKIITNK